MAFTEHSGVQLTLPPSPQPVDFFRQLLDDHVLQQIVDETNRWGYKHYLQLVHSHKPGTYSTTVIISLVGTIVIGTYTVIISLVRTIVIGTYTVIISLVCTIVIGTYTVIISLVRTIVIGTYTVIISLVCTIVIGTYTVIISLVRTIVIGTYTVIISLVRTYSHDKLGTYRVIISLVRAHSHNKLGAYIQSWYVHSHNKLRMYAVISLVCTYTVIISLVCNTITSLLHSHNRPCTFRIQSYISLP